MCLWLYNTYVMDNRLSHAIYVILPKMSDYDERVKKLQAEAWTDLQKDLARAEAEGAKDPLKAERMLFLMELIKARLRKKLSQAGLASKLGTQQSAISRVESGKGNPSLRTLLTIAEALEARLVLEYKE